MPLYDYACPACGPFEAAAPMTAHAAPQPCPACDAAAPRVLLTAPAVSGLSAARRAAYATNERSADSPKRLSGHGAGCSCCGTGGRRASRTLYRPDGTKSLAGARPWMISH